MVSRRDAPDPRRDPLLFEPSDELSLADLSPDQKQVLTAFALGWSGRTRAWVLGWLGELGAIDANGRHFGGDAVHLLIRALAQGGWLIDLPQRMGQWQVAPNRRSAVFLDAIDRLGLAPLRQALGAVFRFDDSAPSAWTHFPDADAAAAIVRLETFGGVPFETVSRLREFCRFGLSWQEVVDAALTADLDDRLFARLEPDLQTVILEQSLARLMNDWIAPPIDAVALARRHLERHPTIEASGRLRLALAEFTLWSDQTEQLPVLLQPLLPDATGAAPAGRAGDAWREQTALARGAMAARLALQGHWGEAESGFEEVLTQLKNQSGKRKGLLPESLALPYALSMLAQGSPIHLERALKFCLGESGKRQASADTGWGLMALAIQVRRGDNRLDLGSFKPLSDSHHVYRIDLWRWLMRAWLKTGSDSVELHPREQDAARQLRGRLTELGLVGLAGQLDAALARLQGEATSPAFFVCASQERWQLALAELATLATGGAAPAETDQSSRLLWVLDVDAEGRVRDLTPFDQKRGPRGWGKPREVTLSRLTKTEGLAPRDAAVAVALRPLPNRERGHRFDLAAAVPALVGHPALELADARGVAIELIEGQAELDVSELGDSVRLRLLPPLRTEASSPLLGGPWSPTVTELKEQEALRLITVLRDGPQRARLIRLSPEQKRAAQLIGEQLVVPKSALSQVQAVLQSLGNHFQVHADMAQDSAKVRQVVSDSRLRAELSPRGDALHVRLVVAPLGSAGPRLAPGHGRSRLLASVDGETLGAPRDLALERAHLETILDACPMLDPDADGGAEWLIDAPDDALALLERLPALENIAGVDWPQGKPIRVEAVGVSQLKVQLRSGREWLALQGGIAVDEAQVISLGQLLEWTRSERSRFVPLGEGRYLALTQELRNRLDELGSVAHPASGKTGRGHETDLQVSPLASAWLDTTLAGTAFAVDQAFESRLARLQLIQSERAVLPGTLQAELRPYQEEGYAWAMRLAESGFGAVLADDMGLGKTLQALAILLARSAGGPALVVAPTSLGGNWLAEARRFAPSLDVSLFGDGERATLIEAAAAGDVIVVSYQLLLMHAAEFAQRQWHTMVLDEAQAIKNATAKRSQAAFELQADFRIALSGTPIENRLSELWSIMRVCNPGLLGSSRQFNERFAGPIERDHNRNAQRTLRRLIAPFVLRRTKAQVLDDLPPRTETTLAIESDSGERAHYETLRRQALAAAEAAVASDKPGQAQLNILAQLTRLRRAACDPRLVSPQLGLVGAKVKAFAELANELRANGHKTLVFSQFVDFLSLLREPLDAAGIPYQYLDGSTPPAERTRRVAAFQAGEGDLFLISLKAGGFGLNLTVADYVVIADPWWNPAAEDQASGRAHRIGQLRPVTVYRMVNQGTLEEKIVQLHQHKRELADSVLDGGEAASPLRAEELIELIRGEIGVNRERPDSA